MRDATQIAARLQELASTHPGSGLAELACHVLALGNSTRREHDLLAEIEELDRSISQMRQEVARLPVDDIARTHIPCATDELDAIVTHTAVATETILESCEVLDTLAETLGEGPSHMVQEMTMRIYEACSFQDITGQRIAKIIATLQAIEAKVGHIRGAFGNPSSQPALPDDASLLNGPQLPANAMAQAEIDLLLADF
jgi:chemotaxis protein CheZ